MSHDYYPGRSGHRVIWISPGRPNLVKTASAAVAHELAGLAVITQIGLAVWDAPMGEPYDLAKEVDAVAVTAQTHDLSRYHLVGFSAGGTVALGAALALGDAVQSVAVLEAAVIGDDDWHPSETAWRVSLAAVRALPAQQRGLAFRQMLMRPGEPVPPLGPPPPWDARTDLLEDMLAHVGFTSDDLAVITQPVLAIHTDRSHPRMAHQSERLAQVIPHARIEVFDKGDHLSPPHKAEPARFAEMLLAFWTCDRGA